MDGRYYSKEVCDGQKKWGHAAGREEGAVSRFCRLSHTIWHCQYHILWVPKNRFRVLIGAVGEAVGSGIQAICGFARCEVLELNVQRDHVHLVVMVPPKLSISQFFHRARISS